MHTLYKTKLGPVFDLILRELGYNPPYNIITRDDKGDYL